MKRALKLCLLGALTLLLAVPAAALTAGDTAPEFKLTDTDGVEHALSTYLQDGKIVVLEWFNPDCPFIKKHHAAHRTMNETYAEVAEKDVVWLAINSSASGKQGHGLARNQKARSEYEMTFPVLIDEKGQVGRAYGARTTPHMFVITSDGIVAYAGAIDDDRSVQKLGKTNHVAAALQAVLKGEKPAVTATKAYGCSVKYSD